MITDRQLEVLETVASGMEYGGKLQPARTLRGARRMVSRLARAPKVAAGRLARWVRGIDLREPFEFCVSKRMEWAGLVALLCALLLCAQNADTMSLMNSFTSQEHWAVQTQKMQNFIYIDLAQVFPLARRLADNTKYDQRLPIGALYQQVIRELESSAGSLEGLAVDFHWADWMNLGNSGLIFEAYERQRRAHTQESFQKLWECIRSDDFMRRSQNPLLAQLKHSDAWIYGFQDPPERIDIITAKGFYEVAVAQRRRVGEQGLWDRYYGVRHAKWTRRSGTTIDLKRLARTIDATAARYVDPVSWDDPVPEEVYVPDEDMRWDLDAEVKKLQAKQDKTKQEKVHLQRLRQCQEAGGEAMFFFPINYLENDRSRSGDHTNFPFFQSVVDVARRRAEIHHMMRSYAKFMRQAGYQYWVFSGNAISWYFNGNNMPWDDDIDVRMSAKEMDRMTITHNATLVLEDPEEGDGMYYFYVSPWFGKETRLGNHIDARFIDVRRGLYIDITCLYEASMKSTEDILKQEHLFDFWGVEPDRRQDYLQQHTVLCDKNNNWFWEDHFRDQFRTLFEGTMVHMPYHYAEVLKYSYGEDVLRNPDFNGFRFFPEVGLWFSGQRCDFDQYQKLLDRGRAFDDNGMLTLEGACGDPDLLDQWRRIHPSIALHRAELVLLKQADRNHFKYSAHDMPLYWHDEFSDMLDFYESNGNANI